MVTKEYAKREIKKLLDRYNKIKDDENLMKNEKQACDSLIRPFFRDVLGWNIDDPYEFKSEYQQGGKRIDYLACIEGVSQFIIEAKAPSKEIKENTAFYRQAIQYAEGKGKDFAILTNFKTFIILRAGIETRGPLVNEIITIDLLDLIDTRLDFLLYFDREFWIEKGGTNPLYSVKNLKKKRPLDEVLVEDMSKWRERLLRSLKAISKDKYNFENEKELEYIEEEIQRFVDRLIFICYCEDKQLTDNELKPLLYEFRRKHIGKKTYIINQIKKIFEYYNRIYDSDLFKEGLCDEFEFDDGILSKILEDLRGYYEGLPYDFSIIDADILGRAYENFLGHIITGKVRFKEKKDIGKRKKMGIYYTPQHIVNYIIKNTIKEKIKDLSFNEILKIKILDPACGSGSFLIKAFDILVDESRVKLERDLTYEEKEKLILNCIYGVDLDERACDIAKLNLSLKLAERNKKLPFLHKNIQNGNSLIDSEEVAGDKAFNWEEKFPFKFDVVIGNPPYGVKFNKEEKTYFNSVFKKFKGKDSASLFIKKGINLTKNNGYFGFIVPKSLTYVKNWEGARDSLIKDTEILKIGDVGKAFENVLLEQIIFISQKTSSRKNKDIEVIGAHDERDFIRKNISKVNRNYFTEEKFLIYLNNTNELLYNKIIKKTGKLSEISKIFSGCSFNKFTKKEYDKKEDIICFKGVDIQRYLIRNHHYLNKKYLPSNIDDFKQRRILVQDIVAHIENPKPHIKITATLDQEGELNLNTITNVVIKDKKYYPEFILAILNSKLMSWFTYLFIFNQSVRTMHLRKGYIDYIPIKEISKKEQEKFVELVNEVLELKKKYHDHKILRKEKIDEIDKEIDQEIYKLYEITEKEISGVIE